MRNEKACENKRGIFREWQSDAAKNEKRKKGEKREVLSCC